MSKDARDRFADYRARLAAAGFRPSSVRGQNFLLDPTLHRWIAEAAAPTQQDLVVEIGVGLGFLTRELAERAGRVVGVELDARLLAIARQELAGQDHVELLHADALGGPGRSLAPELTAAVAGFRRESAGRGSVLVVANLPYSVSGPLLAELALLPELPERIVVLVQRELAERLAAGPGSPEYGGLSALLQASFAVRLLRAVSPEVFRPRPKVVSAVVRLDRRAELPLPEAAARRRYAAFVRRLFGQRRKVLRGVLAEAVRAGAGSARVDREAVAARIAALPAALQGQRAEALSADELVALWRRLA